VQVPADYVKEASIARLAAEGQKLMQKHRAALNEIEKRFGVPASIVLAIWGRETDYGRYRLPYDTLRVVATQAYVGRRKDQYRGEFILALKLLGEGAVARNEFPLVLGRRHRLHAIPAVRILQARRRSRRRRPSRHLAFGAGCAGRRRAAARQQGLAGGVRWAYEVKAPANVDCTMGVPEVTEADRRMAARGFCAGARTEVERGRSRRSRPRCCRWRHLRPSFLTTKNYFVIKEYNFSDLYVLFVGHLADRMISPLPFATPWSASTQLRSAMSKPCSVI
jgi:membrane-bound lytic murein transglycosylase B